MCSGWWMRCAVRSKFEWLDRVGKRLFDMLLSLALLLLLAPLFAALALLIKLDSPGPVFFRQERVGRQGRLFRIHKFRTMAHRPADAGLPLTVGADARITRVGGWLRYSKIDELAQLIDVLIGDMSLVGPRPEVPKYVALYPAALRERVLAVRPGITDPASLAHADESQELAQAADPERHYIEVVMPRKLAVAAAYAEQATLLTDVSVLWRSLLLLLGGRA
jgi:lipopolysaccharide/colanic/teichoic acid biosynthesis glycosyltransferase